MLAIEDLFAELARDDEASCNDRGLPPGFRFHPTDEELITFYLASKVFHGGYSLLGAVPIAEIDLNRCEPWELPELGKMREREWYFFSLRDRKYPTGLRTNRATSAGYWKATGKDREVHGGATSALVGMKKTLVFYRGRAPRGEKTKWVMHEYRLEGELSESCRRTCKEEWVICRIYDKTGDNKIGISMSQSHQAAVTSTAAVSNSFLRQPAASIPLECQIPELFHFQGCDLKSLLATQLVHEPSSLMPLPRSSLNGSENAIYRDQALKPGAAAAPIPTHCKVEVEFPEVYYCHDQNLLFSNQMDGSLMDLAAAHTTSNATLNKYHMHHIMFDPSHHH